MAKKKTTKVLNRPKARESVNPFERRKTIPKFQILGKKVKGTEQKIGQARAKSVEARKKTLLVELQQEGKRNRFVDTRIGEDENLTPEEKALIRFQKEANKRYAKASIYSLDDDTELTHHGAALGAAALTDDYHGSDDDRDDEGGIDADTVEQLHFGGFEAKRQQQPGADGPDEGEGGQHGGPKSRQDVIREIIAKSKMFKYERQKQRAERQDALETLDEDFGAIRSSLHFQKRKDPAALPQKRQREEDDDFERLARELAFEMRATPTDRLKTTEELAREEKERLEKLERDRVRRMHGEEPGSDEEGGAAARTTADAASRRAARLSSGDDLHDGFELDPASAAETLAYDDHGVQVSALEPARKAQAPSSDNDDAEPEDEGDADDQTEDSGEEEDEESESASVASLNEDGIFSADEDEAEEEHTAPEPKVKSASAATRTTAAAAAAPAGASGKARAAAAADSTDADIPFTFAVPKSYDEFLEWTADRPARQVAIIVHRIRACNHVALSPQNREKLQGFYGILLQHFIRSCSAESVSFAHVDVLVQPIFEMSQQFQDLAVTNFKNHVVDIQALLMKGLQSEKRGHSAWVPANYLLLLQLIGQIFPTTDFRHPIVTPVLLLLGEALVHTPVSSIRDVASGLFIANLALQFVAQTHRFFPEVIAFLEAVFYSAASGSRVLSRPQFGKFSLALDGSAADTVVAPIDFNLYLHKSSPDSNQSRVVVLFASLKLLQKAMSIWKEHPSAAEVFQPFAALIKQLNTKQYPVDFQELSSSVLLAVESLAAKVVSIRQPLQLLVKKPQAIKQFTPKFESEYVPGRDYDPDKERSTMRKLKKQHKKETAGAMRELRKDNQFLSIEKTKQKMAEDQDRETKRRRIMAELEGQEHQAKEADKLKKKLKKKNSAF